jgi:hypothetical protein
VCGNLCYSVRILRVLTLPLQGYLPSSPTRHVEHGVLLTLRIGQEDSLGMSVVPGATAGVAAASAAAQGHSRKALSAQGVEGVQDLLRAANQLLDSFGDQTAAAPDAEPEPVTAQQQQAQYEAVLARLRETLAQCRAVEAAELQAALQAPAGELLG